MHIILFVCTWHLTSPKIILDTFRKCFNGGDAFLWLLIVTAVVFGGKNSFEWRASLKGGL